MPTTFEPMAVPSAASDDGVELVFEIRDERYLFTTLSAELDCEVVARQIVQRSDGDLLEFFSVADADPEAVTAFASEFPGVERARTIPRADDELLVEVVLSGECLGAAIADAGAVARDAVAIDGVATVSVDVPPGVAPRSVYDAIEERHDVTRLVSKRQQSTTGIVPISDVDRLLDPLTDKQLRALKVALAGGYYDWPRQSSATECAEALGVSQPTFSQHLRRAESKLLTAVFQTATRASVDRDARPEPEHLSS